MFHYKNGDYMKLRSILLATATVLALMFSASAFTPVMAQNIPGGVSAGADSARGSDQPDDLFGQSGTFQTITDIMLYIIGAISVIMVIIGGLRYVLSGGDSANITAAKNTILYAIVGIIVAILAYAAVHFVIDSFSVGGGGGGGGGATSF